MDVIQTVDKTSPCAVTEEKEFIAGRRGGAIGPGEAVDDDLVDGARLPLLQSSSFRDAEKGRSRCQSERNSTHGACVFCEVKRLTGL